MNRELLERLGWKIRLAMPVALFIPLYLRWFFYLNNAERVHYTIVHTRWDDAIPFIEVFIVPYLLWFFYVGGVVFFLLLFGETEEYLRSIVFLGTGMVLFLVVSTFIPTALQLRPLVMPRDNLFTRLVLMLYRIDTPTNVCPSVHVYNAIGAHMAVRRSEWIPRRVRLASFLLCILIILSTMFLKQHSTFDVGLGMALAAGMGAVVYHTEVVMRLFGRRVVEAQERGLLH